MDKKMLCMSDQERKEYEKWLYEQQRNVSKEERKEYELYLTRMSVQGYKGEAECGADAEQ